MNFLPDKLTLPSGEVLRVLIETDKNYPGISIWKENEDSKAEILCFAEYNSERTEGRRLCIGAYLDRDDEPAFYESYVTGGAE